MYLQFKLVRFMLLLSEWRFYLDTTSNLSLGIMWCINLPILTELARSSLQYLLASSLSVSRGKPAQCFNRWDEVISATDRCCISGQGITDAILCSCHTLEHACQALLVAAEADKHRPMLSGRPERGIAAEDMLFYPIHFDHCARDMGLGTAYFLSQLHTRQFGASDDLLLLLNRERLEGGDIVHPLLYQDHTATSAWSPIGK